MKMITNYEVQFVRRKYGRNTYTWANLILPDGCIVSVGDPYPGINWPKKELDKAISETLTRQGVIQTS